MDAVRNILVGVDFTACSGVALSQAIRLGAAWKARVHPVHVIDTLVVTELEAALVPIQQEIRAALAKEAKAAWTRFAAQVPGAAALEIRIAISNRAEAMLESARLSNAELMVLGAFSEVDPDLGIGTLASDCVRRGATDVLLARENHGGAYRRIVVGIDFSETSRKALARAAQFALVDGAEIHILHVFTPPWNAMQWFTPGPAATPEFKAKYRADQETRLREFARGELEAAGVKDARFAIFDHEGHRSGIVAYAAKVGADLVAIGTRGRSNMRDFLLGSTAEKTLRDCTTSVLAVRPKA